MLGVGLEAGLPTQQRNRRAAELFDRHRQQRDGDLFTGGQQHIHFTLVGMGVDLIGLVDQIVGGIALSGHYDHHVVTLAVFLGNDASHVHHALGIGDRAAAEFLYNQHIFILLRIGLQRYKFRFGTPRIASEFADLPIV